MSLLSNKDVKKFLIMLMSVLFIGIISIQILTYLNAHQYKKEMILHDYELAGYLSVEHPELISEIQAAFTKDKSEYHIDKGKNLLEKVGYKNTTDIHLVHRVNTFYKTNSMINLFFSLIMALAIILITYLFLLAHYKKIDDYNNDITKIMNGEITIRLDDTEEGVMSKLASSINLMSTSLNTHIEKEKHDRNFLKNTLTNISHQLKTPLSALIMYTEIMKDENIENEVIIRFLNKSENELARMRNLIANLLKMARLDAGIIDLNKKTHVLNDIIKQVVESFETRLVREEKTLNIKACGKVSYFCDKEWMFESLSNLIKNAVEHTKAGDHIEILLDETPLMVRIMVKDSGEGIHSEDINHIFKRFYRSRFSQNKQGTGIGLTLAKSIIEMHNGFISVENETEQGTVFIVHLPKLTDL